MTVGKKWLGLPGYAALTASVTASSRTTRLRQASRTSRGRIAPTPVFFIYGEHGQDGERNLNPTYLRRRECTEADLGGAGSGHVGGITARPKEYERRVTGFFDRALLGDASQ